MPKHHSSHFENIPKPGVDDLGQVLHQVLNKLELALDSPAYNYIIHTAPFRPCRAAPLPLAHRGDSALDQGRGLRVGKSGFYINPVPPENAAGFLREVEVHEFEQRTSTPGARNDRTPADLAQVDQALA